MPIGEGHRTGDIKDGLCMLKRPETGGGGEVTIMYISSQRAHICRIKFIRIYMDLNRVSPLF